MLCATIIPIVVSIPDESVEALNAGRSLLGEPSIKANDNDDGSANLENTTEKKLPANTSSVNSSYTDSHLCLLNKL